MADELDPQRAAEIQAAYNKVYGTPQAAQPDEMMHLTAATGLSPERIAEIQKAHAGLAGPRHMGWGEGMLQSVLHGATFGATDNLMSDETNEARKAWGQEHPVLSTIGEGVGVAAPMFIPGVAPARAVAAAGRAAAAAPRAARALEWINPYYNWGRAAAPGASARTMLHQGGVGAVKAGALERFLTPPPKEERDQMGEAQPEYALKNLTARATAAQPWSTQGLQDYLLGAGGAYVGGRAAQALGRGVESIAAGHALGTNPVVGARLRAGEVLREDAPNQDVQSLLNRVRQTIYGDTTWAARTPVFRDTHPAPTNPATGQPFPVGGELMREIVGLRQNALNALPTDANPRQVLAAERGVAAQIRGRGYVNASTGNPYPASTVLNWVRRAGQSYAAANPVHSYLGELAAIGAGGEAASTSNLQRRLLNLAENHETSNWVRGIRERQSQINPTIDRLQQELAEATGDVSATLREHRLNAEASNSLYPDVFDELRRVGAPAQQAISDAIAPVINDVRARFTRPFPGAMGAAAEPDLVSQTMLKQAEKFTNPTTISLTSPSMTPARKAWMRTFKDKATGDITHYTTGDAPILDAAGNPITKLDLGTSAQTRLPSGDLESILQRRRSLGDEITKSQRAGSGNLTHELTQFKNNITNALRGLGDARAPADTVGSAMAKWSAANDTRALAGSLEQTYNRFLGLNLRPARGQSLRDTTNAWTWFDRAQRANPNDPHVDMAKRGIMSQLSAALQNKGQMHDIAGMFGSRRQQALMRRVLGPEMFNRFQGAVSRSGLATQTYGMRKGSHTGMLMGESAQHEMSLSSLAGAVMHFDPFHAWRLGSDLLGRQLHRQRNTELSRLFSQGTHNPAGLEEALRNIQNAVRPRPYIQQPAEALRRGAIPAFSNLLRGGS